MLGVGLLGTAGFIASAKSRVTFIFSLSAYSPVIQNVSQDEEERQNLNMPFLVYTCKARISTRGVVTNCSLFPPLLLALALACTAFSEAAEITRSTASQNMR